MINDDGMTMCSVCSQRPARDGQRTCLDCHAAYMREHRAIVAASTMTDDEFRGALINEIKSLRSSLDKHTAAQHQLIAVLLSGDNEVDPGTLPPTEERKPVSRPQSLDPD